MIVSTPDLAVAKAALTAALLRNDPTPLTRGAADDALELIDDTLDKCSHSNVQACKNWIVANVVPSHGRTAALGKFLVSLSESMEKDFDRPSVRRRRLHALYIVNDVLHHVVLRQGNRGFGALWAAYLTDLVNAASFFSKSPKHIAKVQSLLNLWEERNYLPSTLLGRLREAVPLACDKHSGYPLFTTDEDAERRNDRIGDGPSLHGDALLSWNDQPTGCWEPNLQDGSTVPIRSEVIRPVALQSEPEDDAIKDDVESFILNAKAISSGRALTKAHAPDFNQFGDEIKLDEAADEREKYYGWTAHFSQLMTEKRARATSTSRDRRSRSRTRSPYSDRSRSVSPGLSKSRRGRRRSRDRSRSSSPYRARSRGRHRRGSSYSRSRSPASRRDRSRRRRSRSGYRSRSRSRKTRSRRSSPSPHNDRNASGEDRQLQSAHAAPQPFYQMPFQGSGGQPFPPPPPPPDGYQGTFPPPPHQGGWNPGQPSFVPPPPQGGWNPNQPQFMPPHMGTPWGPGVPSNTPQPPYNGHSQFNHSWGPGGGRGGGGGRGYRGRGRGGYKYESRSAGKNGRRK